VKLAGKGVQHLDAGVCLALALARPLAVERDVAEATFDLDERAKRLC
jgi:hypothetical protein